MSTYWHFECMDHDPPISSDDEFTQHTDDDHYRAGVQMALSRPVPAEFNDEALRPSEQYFRRNAYQFLRSHPSCHLELVNEHGDRKQLQ